MCLCASVHKCRDQSATVSTVLQILSNIHLWGGGEVGRGVEKVSLCSLGWPQTCDPPGAEVACQELRFCCSQRSVMPL